MFNLRSYFPARSFFHMLLDPISYGEFLWSIGEPKRHWHPLVRQGWQRIDDDCPF